MKVGILSWIIDRQRTGVDNYLYYLLNNLVEMGKSDEITLIHYKKTSDPIYEHINDVLIPKIFPKLTDVLSLPETIKKADVDILHYPIHWHNQITPFFLNRGVKKVLTIHDLTPLLFPETHVRKTVLLWNSSLKLIKNRVDMIIADSQNTKNDCMKYLDIPGEKIKVVHLAADTRYKPLKNKEELRIELESKYGLKHPFILSVGTLEKRKNISTLLKAFHKLKSNGVNHKLVITGGEGWKYHEIFDTLDKYDLKKDVIFTGYVPDDDLVKLYNSADVFVYPSLYEGFGLPPLEAMACGCPVITSNTSSLPEVVGDAGIMVDPLDADGLYQEIYEILTDDKLKSMLMKKSLQRASMFNWRRTAQETWDIYEEIYMRE